MMVSTLARVAGATSARPLRTLETVGTETPASWAIFEIVIGIDAISLAFGSVSARFRAHSCVVLPGPIRSPVR
jgi:hypothetical protein